MKYAQNFESKNREFNVKAFIYKQFTVKMFFKHNKE